MADSQRKTANLFDLTTNMTSFSCSASIDNNGNVKQTNSGSYARSEWTFENLEANKYYTLKVKYSNPNSNSVRLNILNSNAQTFITSDVETDTSGDLSVTFQAQGGNTFIRLYSNTLSTVTFTAVVFSDIMLNEGTTALPYEPYGWQHSLRKLGTATETIQSGDTIYANGTAATVSLKGNTVQNGTPTPSAPVDIVGVGELETTGEHAGQYKIPILIGGTTNNVYLGEVQTERKIKKLVLTGEEDWTRTANEKCYYINSAKGCPADYLKSNIITAMCSHYIGQINTSSGSNEVNEGCICFFTGGGFELYIGERTITSATDFKSYLAAQYAAGTPVTVWYVLSSATTGIVNEPLRKIGDYADTVSGITIPTITGKDTFDVETTLKPSEASLSYTGWHDATVEEWDGSQWNE